MGSTWNFGGFCAKEIKETRNVTATKRKSVRFILLTSSSTVGCELMFQ
jgi:hypothetical protein